MSRRCREISITAPVFFGLAAAISGIDFHPWGAASLLNVKMSCASIFFRLGYARLRCFEIPCKKFLTNFYEIYFGGFKSLFLLRIMKKVKKRYTATKYKFNQMNVGDEKGIKVGRFNTDTMHKRVKAACRMENINYGTSWVTRVVDNMVYYKRTA